MANARYRVGSVAACGVRSLRVAGSVFCTLMAAAACQAAPGETAPAAPAGPEASYEITLRPELGEDGMVEAIAVTSRLHGDLKDGETRLKLSAPVVYVNVMGIADRILDLRVTDEAGPVAFTLEQDDPVPGGFPYFRHWTATRDVEFPLDISYRALVQPEGGPSGPAFGIRPSKGGVSGSGAGYMIVPVNAEASQSVLEWDLTEFGPGAVGVTTFGEGRVTVNGPPAALMQGWLMAGQAGQYPPAEEESHFRAYWLGDFPFDVAAEMAYAKDLYDFFGEFFAYLDPAPDYRVFLRQLDTEPYGGATALANSFMLSRGPALPEEMGGHSPRSTLAHEMIHMWVGGLSGEHVLTNWFSEGLTTYYEHTAPFRAGRVPMEEYVSELNALSERYYTNPAREMSAIEIGQVGFNDGRIRHAPYERGALYFADLDSRIRAASGGARTLDMLLREVFTLRERGDVELTIEAWSDFVSAELGAEEEAYVRALHIDGQMIYPASDAFGACVRGVPATLEAEGDTFEGMQWERVEGVAPEACFASMAAD
ncbi:putative lipoprotein [Hyphomonas neptunium ATCC 15444]|uniref:Putative lipoprotein n=1 Tax=Hyphomonas neptunium (strain ATCC 15444) TaxID=228405 RepID=Q0BZ07_HYPNA|nr:putative lipoprotein [Hyphomonas neptunium]ABI76229.1 putative lipoprotein [Hyphomonas neptunium ATCC 15444]